VVVAAGTTAESRVAVAVEEVSSEEGVAWIASTPDSCSSCSAQARVAVTRVAALCGLAVLEILAPDEMSREEEVLDHVGRAQAAYSGWLQQRLGALVEESQQIELAMHPGADEPQGDGQ
jgi:hypothetical protein